MNSLDGKKKGPILENYKIIKCKFWEKDHICKYGTLCTFAHGDEEIRTKSDNILKARAQGLYPLNNINNNFNYINNMNPFIFGMPTNQIINSNLQNNNNNILSINNLNGINNNNNNFVDGNLYGINNNEQFDMNLFNLKGIFNTP